MTNVGEMQATDATDPARPVDDEVKQLLVDNHRAFLRFLERRVGRRDVAEDILQDAFARGLDRVADLRDGEAVTAWFYRVLRNATVDYYRRAHVGDRALARFAQEVDTAQEPTETMRAEVCLCVSRLAGALKPEYADALRRVEVDGVSVKSFAVEQGISPSNAAVRLFLLREALRRQLAISCGTCAEHGCIACTCVSEPGRSEQGSCKKERA